MDVNYKMADEDDELHIQCMDAGPMRTFLRYLVLFIGCCAVGISFCVDLFTVYGDAYRDAFGFTQRDLWLIILASNLGLISSLPTGMLIRKYDPRWLSGAAFILSTLSCLLIWGTTYHMVFYKEYYWIPAIYYFFLGCSGGMMYMLAVSVNLLNFGSKHAGIVSGVLHASRAFLLGVLLLVHDLYNGVFNATNATPIIGPSNITTTVAPTLTPQERATKARFLQQFFQNMLLVYGGVNFMACMFYGKYGDFTADSDTSDNGMENEMVPIKANGRVYGTSGANGPSADESPRTIRERSDSNTSSRRHQEDQYAETDITDVDRNGNNDSAIVSSPAGITSSTADLVVETEESEAGYIRGMPVDTSGVWTRLMKNKCFHWLLWPTVFLVALRNAYVSNLSLIMSSFALEDKLKYVVYAVPVAGVGTSLFLGIVSDIGQRLPKSLFIFLTGGSLIFINLTNMGFVGKLTLIIVTTIWYQITASSVQTLAPGIHLKLFDKEAFPLGWGIITFLQTIMTVLTKLLMVALYDVFTPSGDTICTGFKCYIVYFLVCALVAYGSIVAIFFLVRHEYDTRPKR